MAEWRKSGPKWFGIGSLGQKQSQAAQKKQLEAIKAHPAGGQKQVKFGNITQKLPIVANVAFLPKKLAKVDGVEWMLL